MRITLNPWVDSPENNVQGFGLFPGAHVPGAPSYKCSHRLLRFLASGFGVLDPELIITNSLPQHLALVNSPKPDFCGKMCPNQNGGACKVSSVKLCRKGTLDLHTDASTIRVEYFELPCLVLSLSLREGIILQVEGHLRQQAFGTLGG